MEKLKSIAEYVAVIGAAAGISLVSAGVFLEVSSPHRSLNIERMLSMEKSLGSLLRVDRDTSLRV